MNEQERSELEQLKRRHERLGEEFGLLSKQLVALEKRLAQPGTQQQAASPQPAKPEQPTFKLKLPEPSPTPAPEIRIPPQPAPAQAPKPSAVPPPIPPVIRPSPVFVPEMQIPIPPPPVIPPASAPAPAVTPEPVVAARVETPPLPPLPPSIPPRQPAAQPRGERSFEMRLGTVWLGRIGIVMFLTGLVFFGNFAYQKYVVKFGPSGKLALLYMASAGLLGAGAWLQRKPAKESMRNFAQVLIAGGLAAVYFTTYAAHHFEHLRVIQNKWLDGALLLGWAGFMVWIADRKKSEVMALFAVLLAYYTSVVTNVGLFTLYSNLILTLAAVFFLLRNRWAILSFASLSASYAAYGYWRFFYGHVLHFPSLNEELWTGTWFLTGYWAVFTAAVFLSRSEKFSGEHRASFLTINNGAFFAMFLLTMYELHSGGFWKFALIYGSTLLFLAALARWVMPSDPLVKNTYLTQGLLLATAGIITHPRLAGMDLSLVLALESVTLMMAGQFRKNRILRAGGYISAALAVGWGMNGMAQHDPHGLSLGMGLAGLMLFNAWWIERPVCAIAKPILRASVSYFTVLALSVLFVVTYNNTTHEALPLVLAGEATLFIFSIYLLQIREFTIFGGALLAMAQGIWLFQAFTDRLPISAWNPTTMILLTTGLTAWWRKQKTLDLRSQMDPDWQALEKLPLLAKYLILAGATYYAVQVAGNHSAAPAMVLWLPIWLGVLMLGDVLLAHRQVPLRNEALRFQPAFSTILALIAWLAVTWHQTSPKNFPLALALEGLVLTLSIYALRVPEIPRLAQGYFAISQAVWLANFAVANRGLPPWWNSAALIAIILFLSHWWQKQKVLETPNQVRSIWQGAYALALVAVLYYCVSLSVDPTVWLALAPLLALALTIYGVMTRAWLLAAFGQIFVLVSGLHFASRLLHGEPNWYFPLVPIAALALLAYGTVKWFQIRTDANPEIRRPLLQLATVYRWSGLLMSLWWVYKYIPERNRVWVFMLLGFTAFLFAGWRKNREDLLFCGVFTAAGLAFFWLPFRDSTIVYWPNLLAILILLVQQAIAKRLPEHYQLDAQVHGATIIAGSLSLWLLLSRWICDASSYSAEKGGFLTASWCVLASLLFIAGILLRERVYRWLGLAILASAIGRVMIIDVWRLAPIFKILSFMALGLVLLVLGFIYNKYQEKIKEWL